LDNDIALKELNEERQNHINDLYTLRMDVSKKIDDLSKRN
jgi:hypothetical protein